MPELNAMKENKELIRGELELILAHCPGQAYITLSERCIYDCKICSVPKLPGKIKTLEEVVAMVETARKTGGLKAIALTSGIAQSPEDEIDRVTEAVAVKALKKYNVPIGVSVHPAKDSSQRLKEAGVVEVKYNVETMDRAIFERVCKGRKGLSLELILESLRDAVRMLLDKYGLRVDVSQTMCLPCTGCDMTPYTSIVSIVKIPDKILFRF